MKPKDTTSTSKQRWQIVSAVLVFLLLAIVFHAYVFERNTVDLETITSRYPLLDPARNIIPQEHYFSTLQPLRETLNTLADDFGVDNVSLYMEFLNTGASILVGPDVYIWSASLPKLPIAMSVMKKIEEGEWKLSNELVLMPQDKNKDSGSEEDSLWEHPVGTRFTIETLLQELLIHSDNTAHNIIYRNLHADELDRVVIELGLYGLFNEDGKMSAKEYSRFFRSLYTANFLNRDSSQRILMWLDESPFNDFLGRAIPEGVPFPHKYGENRIQRVYADSGIVYVPGRPYLITVMISGNSEVPVEEDRARAETFMHAVSEAAYTFVASQ